jgi:NAD+ synthase
MKKDNANKIVSWIKNYANHAGVQSLIVGVSGGIDSALVSTLCAKTGLKTYVVSLPIKQPISQHLRAINHINWLKQFHENVIGLEVNLTEAFESFRQTMDHINSFGNSEEVFSNQLALANTRSRLRMTALYQIATTSNGIVVGTGNKIEDFGVGFFTKYGDGGVDISPIGDLLKSEVRTMARELGVIQEIVEAKPTDGLWDDDRSDEDQIGATYEELEWAMAFIELNEPVSNRLQLLTDREKEVLSLYQELNRKNQHKMLPIPVFKLH